MKREVNQKRTNERSEPTDSGLQQRHFVLQPTIRGYNISRYANKGPHASNGIAHAVVPYLLGGEPGAKVIVGWYHYRTRGQLMHCIIYSEI